MTTSVRPYDSVGRYGGEGFLIVAPNCDLEQAARLAECRQGYLNANKE
jgi:GGDEF domain-containing protein